MFLPMIANFPFLEPEQIKSKEITGAQPCCNER
jgi:hypothetical protein